MDFFLMAWEKDPWHFGFFDWMIATGDCKYVIDFSKQNLFVEQFHKACLVIAKTRHSGSMAVCVANDYSWVTVQSVWSSWCGMCGERKRGLLFTVLTFTARMSSCFSSCCHLADAVSCQQWTERWAELVSNPRY